MYNPFFMIYGRKQPKGLRYATLSSRFFGMTIDVMILIMVMTPFVRYFSTLFFPDLSVQAQASLLSQSLQGLAEGQMSLAEVNQLLVQEGIVAKILLDHALQIVGGGLLVIWCWNRYHTTPGLALLGIEIADAETGGHPSLKQYIIRYIGVILCMIPLGIGMIWVMFNRKRQAWQDLLAGTVVLKKKSWYFGKEYPAPTPEENEEETERKDKSDRDEKPPL